jgi:hypothetical protein
MNGTHSGTSAGDGAISEKSHLYKKHRNDIEFTKIDHGYRGAAKIGAGLKRGKDIACWV